MHHAEHLNALRKAVGSGKSGAKELLAKWDEFVERREAEAGKAGGGDFTDMEQVEKGGGQAEMEGAGLAGGRASGYAAS